MLSREQLSGLLDEISRGRTESPGIDWKRGWWRFAEQKGQDEFRKDVTAIANSCGDEAGLLLIGVEPSQLWNAPLPRDEASIQELLKQVQPRPNLRLQEFEFDSKTITVASVEPPFNRPYVALEGSKHVVYVRKGSSTTTASRFDLDHFFGARTRSPSLMVGWLCWDGLPLPNSSPRSAETLRLPALPAGFGSPDAAAFDLRRGVERLEAEAERLGLLESETFTGELADYRAQLESFIDSLRRPDYLDYWLRSHRLRFFARAFGVWVKNSGDGPATTVKISIELPRILRNLPEEAQEPHGYVGPPNRPSIEKHVRRRSALVPDLGKVFSPQWDVAIPRLPDLARYPDHSYFSQGGESAEFELDRLLHAHTFAFERMPLHIMAMPGSLDTGQVIKLATYVFCEEQPDWTEGELRVEGVPPDPDDLL